MRQFRLEAPVTSHLTDESASHILDGLNEAQRDAASTVDGPVLIIAGPGSGKTRALTHRVAYLIASGRARPAEILALTFTNKAAREMKGRILDLTGAEDARDIWMGTFHATFARVLRREAKRIGFTSDFTIYDTDDQDRILRDLMVDYQVDYKQFSVATIRSSISSAKNHLVSPSDYERAAKALVEEKVARVYRPYQDVLRQSNAMDFDDLLIKPIELFRSNEDVLGSYRRRWKFVHIDEYQDTNKAQYQLARLLAAEHKNLCVVGDDAQSIYAFRGADIGNILSFQRDYPEARVVKLEQNYRSTKKILRIADSIIKHNKDQLEKSLWTQNGDGDDVVLAVAMSERDEAHKIERTIRDLAVRGFTYRDFAVLYRTNSQSRSLEDALRRGGIPYRVVGGVSFYQRKEIKDVLAYLRLVVNPHDTASLRRVINFPTRGIGAKTVRVLSDFASANDVTLWGAIEVVDDVALSKRAKDALRRFAEMIRAFAASAGEVPAEQIARDLVKQSGLTDELRREHTTENLVRWENVQELISAIAEYTAGEEEGTSLSTFLQEVSLLTDADQADYGENRVTLMTLHASKGLEYPVVFVSGMEEGLFPLARAAQDRKEMEEERRLFYVGATRAQQRLFLTAAKSRFRYGEQTSCLLSRFVDELDPGILQTESGSPFESRPGRFQSAPTERWSYDGLDPHYYRSNLRDVPASRNLTTRTRPEPPDGRRVVYDEGMGGEIVPGIRVEHNMFGEGKVIAVEGQGAQAKATVFFKGVGQKKLLLRFAGLNVVG